MKANQIQFRRTNILRNAVAVAAGLCLASEGMAQTEYSWTGATDINWSTGTNWAVVTGSGTPPPIAGDTADLNSTTTDRKIVYDASASGALGTLNLTQTDNAVNLLDVTKSLAITSALTVQASAGTAKLYVDPGAGNSVLTDAAGFSIQSGGLIKLSSYQASTGGVYTSTITGPVTIGNGGQLIADQTKSLVNATSGLNTMISSSLTMGTGGFLSWGSQTPTGNAALAGGTYTSNDRLYVVGNLTITGGTILVGNPANADLSGNELYLQGPVNSITGLTGAFTPFVVLNASQSQSFKSDSSLPGGFAMRGTGANQTFTVGATSPTGTLVINSVFRFQASASTPSLKLALASNITSNKILSVNSGGSGNVTFGLDLNGGKTLDVTQAATVQTLGNGDSTTAWNIVNTGGSASAVGTFKAYGFNLSTPSKGSTIGSFVNLTASGSGGVPNILSNALGTIDPTSTFTYAGSAPITNFDKLTSTRTIGNLATTSGALQLASGINTSTGVTTVGANSTLDLGGQTLTTPSLALSGTLNGAGNVSGNVVASAQGIIQPGGNGSIGSMILGGLTTTSGTSLLFDLATTSGTGVITGNDLLTLGSGTTSIASGTSVVLNSSPSTAGADYRLIGGTVAGIDPASFSVVATQPSGISYSLSNTVDPGFIDLVVSASSSGANNLLWDNIGTGDGVTWDDGTGAGSQNWNNRGTAAVFTPGDSVNFTDNNAGNYSINIGANVAPSAVTVNSAGVYNIGSTGGFGIADASSGPTTLVQMGGGTLNLSSTNTYTGATNVSGSGTTLHLTDTGALASKSLSVGTGSIATIDGLLTGTPAVTVSGTLSLGASDSNNNPGPVTPFVRAFASLNVSSGGSVKITAAATSSSRTVLATSIASNLGQIDLTNNDLIVHNADMGSVTTAGSIANQIASGYNQGNWNGSAGIVSSTAAVNHLTALGYAPGGTTFDGVSTSSTDMLVKYTYFGDADLNGTVDSSDYTKIDFAFLADQSSPSAYTGWSNGDFNYDGVINGSDYTLIDNAFNTQGASLAQQIAGPTAQVAGMSAVPEPTSLALVVLGTVGLLGRRKTRRLH